MTAIIRLKRYLQFALIAICYSILQVISGITYLIGNLVWDIVRSVYRMIIGFVGFILSVITFFGFILWLFTL